MHAIKWNRRGLSLAFVAAGTLSAQAATPAPQKVPLPRPRPAIHAVSQPAPLARAIPVPQNRPPDGSALSAYAQANVGLRGAMVDGSALFKPLARPVSGPF